MKKKLLTLLMSALLVLTACSGGNVPEGKEDGKQIKIGIVQLIEHKALDQARLGFEESLKTEGLNVSIDYKSAQGEITNARTIVEKFVKDQVDLIFAIATPAAQAAQAVAPKDMPIIFSAVTDAVSAGLVESNEAPAANLTGTSDKVELKGQLSLFKEIDPSIQKIGFIYSADEDNSVVQLKEVENFAAELALEVVPQSIQNLSDLPQAAQSIVNRIDGLYIPSDNKVASSITLLTDVMNEHKIVTVGAEDAHVAGGALISKGISYFQLGQQAGQMAVKILRDGKNPSEIPVETANEISKIVNLQTLEDLGLNKESDVFSNAKALE